MAQAPGAGRKSCRSAPLTRPCSCHLHICLLAPSSETVKAIHAEYADPDGFLYVTYFQDDAFGSETC